MTRRVTARRTRGRSALAGALTLTGLMAASHADLAAQRRAPRDTVPTLGLEQGVSTLDVPGFDLKLVNASQTVAGLLPKGADGFDFTPSDWLERRAANDYYHLGDLNLRLRTPGSVGWTAYSTAAHRAPVDALPASGTVLAAADLAPTLPDDIPLAVRRYWEVEDGHLALRFELENRIHEPVEIGGLGIPMVFNNILSDRSLDEAHAVSVFYDPYIGEDAGYLQVTRLSGHGPALLVVPSGDTPLEGYNPLLDDPTGRGITFEGFYAWEALTEAFAEDEWSDARPWNTPTLVTLGPGERRSWGVRFLLADSIRGIEETLLAAGRPVAVGVPGYVLPTDMEAQLFLKHTAEPTSMEVEPAGALSVEPAEARGDWLAYDVRGLEWGRARLTVQWSDGITQTISYKVIEPEAQVVADMGHFLTTKAWFEDPDDPFGRSPSVITYDIEEDHQVTEDSRAWVAGLSDEGGAGAWLAAVMKQLVEPDPAELDKLETFVDSVVWGRLQYAEGDRKYGVRKSLFYYAPDDMPAGTYSDSIRYGGWSSWDLEEATSVGRSYNYPHVAAAYWVLYRLARNHEGLVTNHPWSWYLDRAWRTGEAMVEFAPHYAQFGQMEGTVFVRILEDLRREGWNEQADAYEATMRERADVWRALGYPFGSEMPWDSTGQEEVYAWSRWFGYDEKADVTLNAILAYMPTVPHWGYNGSARRYWDFQYAGKTRRLERQLHHYGSPLNAIPVLSEFRREPTDLYLLRVGYGGLMGSLSNITREGFPPAAFHAYPSTLDIDGITGDYGTGFLGYALNTGTYVTRDPTFGWLAFGGNLDTETDGTVRVTPLDAARSRVYVAPLGLWLTLDAGAFRQVAVAPDGTVRVSLDPADAYTPVARLRVERPGSAGAPLSPEGTYESERGAYVVPLSDGPTEVVLR